MEYRKQPQMLGISIHLLKPARARGRDIALRCPAGVARRPYHLDEQEQE